MLCGQLVRCSVQLHGAIAAYESIPNSLISVLFPSFFDMETSPLSSDNVVNRTARRKKWIMLLMMTRLIRNYSFPLILMKHHITLACPFFFYSILYRPIESDTTAILSEISEEGKRSGETGVFIMFCVIMPHTLAALLSWCPLSA